jgi:purine-binding chemotaxis protein CheW
MFLLATAASRICAFPLAHVIEIMRPLPLNTIGGSPSFIQGLSIIRDAPVPVVHVGSLLGAASDSPVKRFVTMRDGERRVALGVESVSGVAAIDQRRLQELPALLGNSSADVIDSIGTADARLLVVLRSAHVVPDEVWRAIDDSKKKP